MYYVIFDQNTKSPSILENDLGFIEEFATYESAKREAEICIFNGDCRSYVILAECTGEKNHII